MRKPEPGILFSCFSVSFQLDVCSLLTAVCCPESEHCCPLYSIVLLTDQNS
ncbi:hypothetical protein EGY05_20555 [Chryseobacterium arthrosphaerae]|nr:hypothetical protein EGY05_20555 [Chryseobacterium arthrosphaerae]